MATATGQGPATELAGRVALVTGGARNIGRAIAQALAAAGAAVAVSARSASDDLAATVRLIEDAGGRGLAVAADVTDAAAVQRMVDATVAHFGHLDILVNNAAQRTEQPFAAIGFDDWRRIVSIVLDGAFLCSQAALPHLRRAGGGTIVNIGGETGHKGAAMRAHVVTAKAGLAGFTKALALDLAGDGITVNCVVPGRIATVRAGPGALKQSGGSLTARDSIMRQVLQNASGARWAFISFPGGGERLAALLGGHVDMMIVEPQEAREQLRAGKLRVIAQVAGKRLPAFPDVPTLKEAGYDVALVPQMRGAVAPPDLPPEVAAYWRDFFARLVRTPAWRKYLEDNQFEDGFRSGPEFTKTIDETSKQLRTLLQEAGVKVVR